MPGTSQFVLGLLADKTVVPWARAIASARILCRGDIVTHLATYSRNVQSGQLPVHMQAVAEGAEAAMRRAPRQLRAERAGKRHQATGVKREQKMFVWVSFVDAYITAAQLAGYRPTERDLWGYMDAMQAFGRAYGLSETPAKFSDAQRSLERLMTRIQLSTVPLGGWGHFAQVARSDWFDRDSQVSLDEIVKAVRHAVPGPLVEALRR